MLFSDRIPEVYKRSLNAVKLVNVLDGVEAHKKLLVEKHTRFYCSPILMSKLFLRKKLADYGHPPIPEDFHKDQLDALLLNSNDIMALKGSYQGLRLWLWCLTFGSIEENYTDFYPIRNFIILNEVGTYGYVSNIAPPDDFMTLYLFSGADNFGQQILTISIGTKYHWMVTLKKYIEDNIKDFLGFTDANTIIEVTLQPGVYNTNTFPFQYFVIT